MSAGNWRQNREVPFCPGGAVRLVLLLAGLCVAHLGVTLFLQTDLGSDPFNVFVQGLFRFLPWPGFMTHGRVHLLVSLVIMVVPLVVDRKFVRIGTVVCMALGGPIIDVFTVLLAPPDPQRTPPAGAAGGVGFGLCDPGLRHDHCDLF